MRLTVAVARCLTVRSRGWFYPHRLNRPARGWGRRQNDYGGLRLWLRRLCGLGRLHLRRARKRPNRYAIRAGIGLYLSLIALFVSVSNLESALSGVALVVISAPVYLWLRRVRHLDQESPAEA